VIGKPLWERTGESFLFTLPETKGFVDGGETTPIKNIPLSSKMAEGSDGGR